MIANQILVLTELKGILQTGSPFLLRLIGSCPQSRIYMMWVGMVLVVASTIGAAFSRTVSHAGARMLTGCCSHIYTGSTSNHDSRVDVRSLQRSSLFALCQLR